MGYLEKAISTDDLDWLEKRFEKFAGFYNQETSTNAAEHAEIDAEIKRAKDIIERIKTRIIVRQAR